MLSDPPRPRPANSD